jgi:hypothetical protein
MHEMRRLMGTRTMTIEQMIEEKFCIEMNIMKDTLVNRCESLAAFGVLKKSRVKCNAVEGPVGLRRITKRNAYTIIEEAFNE